MNLFFYFLFITFIKCETICETTKAFIHHGFRYDECETISRRNGDPYSWCENQGTWTGEKFKCYYPADGYCRYGYTEHSQTCIPKVLKSVDEWIYIEENHLVDWETNILNLDIRGNGGTIQINGTTFEDVYEIDSEIEEYSVHLAITLEYNESCITNLKLYFNKILIVEVTEEMDYYWWILLRSMVEVDREFGNNEKVYMVAAWECVLTEEQVEYLYNLGPNRTANVTLEHCNDYEYMYSKTKNVSVGWMISCIVISITIFIVGILIVGIIGYRNFILSKRSKTYRPLSEE